MMFWERVWERVVGREGGWLAGWVAGRGDHGVSLAAVHGGGGGGLQGDILSLGDDASCSSRLK